MYANVDDVIVADDDEVVYVYYFSFFFSPRLHHSGNTTPVVLAASFHSRDQSLALPFPGTACPSDLLLFALFLLSFWSLGRSFNCNTIYIPGYTYTLEQRRLDIILYKIFLFSISIADTIQ